MILEPHHMWRLAREMNVPAAEMFEQKLIDLHKKHSLSTSDRVIIPNYWAETVYYGIVKLIDKFPEIKFGGIYDDKNKLRIYTIPSHTPIVAIKWNIYNDVDKLIIATVDRLIQSPKSRAFLI